MLVFRLLKKFSNVRALAIIILAGKVNSKFCNGGHICSPPKECCPLGCCLVFASPGYRPSMSQSSETSASMSHFITWNHWLFWTFLVLLLLVFMCGCGLWKKRHLFANRWHRRRSNRNEEERSDLDSTGSCYPPPQYSRCSSFNYAPPPYTEVTSKPDLYPLVISYTSDNGKFGDNCVMVQYFRNYVVHSALGSLSAGSTIDSINSNFFGQAVTEQEANYPPSYEEFRMGERETTEVQPLNTSTPIRPQANNNYLPQGQNPRQKENGHCVQGPEMQQIIVENIHQSIQKASTTTSDSSYVKTSLPTTFSNAKVIKNSLQSLPSHLYSEPTINRKAARPNHLYLNKRNKKPVVISDSTDSINGNNVYSAHQYTSDVILAQPQSYCESSDLHYYSSDILNHTSHFLNKISGSYSSEDNLSQPRGSLQDFVSSDGLSHSQFSNLEMTNFSTSSDVSSLQGCGSPDSPPRAISPTGEFRNLLEKIQQLPSQKHSESKGFYYDNDHYRSHNAKVPFFRECVEVDNLREGSEDFSDNEELEKSNLLSGSQQSITKKSKRVTVAVSNAVSGRKDVPSRSKTFYMPFCHSTLSLKKNSSSKASTSAPVTPVTNFPSPGSATFSFPNNPGKFGTKKCADSNPDGTPLLQDEDESNDEIF